jgi:hypothetical protein
MPKCAEVADTVWTISNFQTTDAEDGEEFVPHHHLWRAMAEAVI